MDRHTRSLERRARAGDVAAEVLLLLQQLRAGTLTDDRLRLAAYLGHDPCRQILEERAPQIPDGYQAWLTPLREFGPEVEMRASIAAARRVAPVYASVLRPDDPEHPRPIVEAAELSVECPCVPHVQAVLIAAQRCESARQSPDAVKLDRQAEAALSACTSLAALFGEQSPVWPVMHHARLAAFHEIEEGGAAHADETLPGEAGRIVKNAIRDALIPWALGRSR